MFRTDQAAKFISFLSRWKDTRLPAENRGGVKGFTLRGFWSKSFESKARCQE